MGPYLTRRAHVMDRIVRDELGDGLVDVVLRLRDSGLSTREVAVQLHEVTGFRVTHETVRGWELEWRAYLAGDAA